MLTSKVRLPHLEGPTMVRRIPFTQERLLEFWEAIWTPLAH